MSNLFFTFDEHPLCTYVCVNYLTKKNKREISDLIADMEEAIRVYRVKGIGKCRIERLARDITNNESRNCKIDKHEDILSVLCDDLMDKIPTGAYATEHTVANFIYNERNQFCNRKVERYSQKEHVCYPKMLARAVLERMVENGDMTKIFDNSGTALYIKN